MVMRCKIGPRMSENLSISGMVRGFNARNMRQKVRVVTSNMLHKVEFGSGRTSDEHFAGFCTGFCDSMKEIFIRVMFFSQFGMMRLKRQLVCLLRIEVKNFRFFVVDPDDGVKMRHSAFS